MERSRIAWNRSAPATGWRSARWLLRLAGVLLLTLAACLVAGVGQARAAGPGGLGFKQPTYRGVIGGPPGALVEVDGSGWISYSSVTLTLTNSGTCGTENVGTFPTDTNGDFMARFLWPLDYNQLGTYHVCGTQVGAGSAISISTFTLFASSPPTLTVSPSSLVAGEMLTISGTNWVPGPQTLNVTVVPCETSCNAAPVALQTIETRNDGTFSQQLTISASAPSGSYYVQAANSSATLSVAPVGPIQVSGQATASGTPVPGVSPTVTSTRTSQDSGGSIGTPSPISQASSDLKNALLAAGLGLVALLVLIGGLAFFIGRSRGPDVPARPKPKEDEQSKTAPGTARQAPWRSTNPAGAAAPQPEQALALQRAQQRQSQPFDEEHLAPADEEVEASQEDEDEYPPEEQIPTPPPDLEEFDQGKGGASTSGHLYDRSARYQPARRFPRPGSSADQ